MPSTARKLADSMPRFSGVTQSVIQPSTRTIVQTQAEIDATQPERATFLRELTALGIQNHITLSALLRRADAKSFAGLCTYREAADELLAEHRRDLAAIARKAGAL